MTRDTHIEALPMPIVYVQHLAREFPETGRLLAGTDLTAADLECTERSISVRTDLRCVANAIGMATRPNWYHQWAIRLADQYHGALGAAWLNAPTLGHGLDAFQQYFPRRIPYMDIRSYATATDHAIELRPLLDVGPLLPLLIEVPLLILQRYVGNVLNQRITAATVELGYPAPDYADTYADTFEATVRFGCHANRLLVPIGWRAVRNLAYDESAWRNAIERNDQWTVRNNPREIVHAVRNEIFAALDRDDGAAIPTLKSIAARLLMSPRTLTRRLQALGTSFSHELDDVRRARARTLVDSGLRVSQIAARLKYTDTANFSKAFRRWFGVAPSRYRSDGGNRDASPDGDDG